MKYTAKRAGSSPSGCFDIVYDPPLPACNRILAVDLLGNGIVLSERLSPAHSIHVTVAAVYEIRHVIYGKLRNRYIRTVLRTPHRLRPRR